MDSTPLTIFISSTFSDLVKYRESVHATIQRLQTNAVDMIFWSADDRTPSAASVDRVHQSDLLILILAHKYGSIVSGSAKSFVELEYEAAREKGIPVLAFFLEPTYPWPPNEIDLDGDNRAKLDSFKRKVETECVRQFFTTIESLAIAVTQAIANFDKRRNPSATGTDIGIRINQEIVRERLAIPHQTDLNIIIGEAEDGLPLLLRIIRSQDINKPLEGIAKALDSSIEQLPLSAISKTLLDEGQRVWRETGIHDVRLPDGHRCRCYVSYENLSDFFTPSLITRLLTAANYRRTIIPKQQSHYQPRTEQTMPTPISARHGRDKRVQSSGGANRFLAVSIDGEDVYVVGWDYVNNWQINIAFWRNFVCESILGLSEWTFELIETHSYERRIVASGDAKAYYQKVFRTIEKPKYFEDTSYTTRIRISRRSLTQVILMAAEGLKDIHNSGCIHGDLKPQNMLLSKNGVVLIDSLLLKEGEISPGLSPDWASPEQLLMRPVSKASDIYPLGLMLCMIIGGQLTGEYVQYVLPYGGEEPLIVPVLRDPIVYLGIKEKSLSTHGRKVWFDFIESCLRYDPSQRPIDADSFIKELKTIRDAYPLESYVEFELKGTLLPELALFPDGAEKPCRVIADRWTSLERTRVDQW